MIISTYLVGFVGPKVSVMEIKTTMEPTVAITMVQSNICANFWKNVITVNSMITAAHNVVIAAARIAGPMLRNA
jgi:hypothetical protein